MNLLTFQWRAVDASGATRSGSLTARGEAEALRQIAAMGLTPVRLAATAAGGGRISGKDLAHLKVTKNPSDKEDILAITGATITSRAVTEAVREAVEKLNAFSKENRK